MGDVLTAEFFLEQFRKLHDRMDKQDEKIDYLVETARQVDDKLDAMREHVGTQQMDITLLHRRVDFLYSEMDKIRKLIPPIITEH